MRRGILICTVWALAAALAAHAADQTTAGHSEHADYVVWVDKLNLRAKPSMEGDIVTVLEWTDRLMDLGREVEYVDDLWWRRVRAGESEGWVADCYILTNAVYGAFVRADELGKAGDAEGMVAAIDKGCKDLTGYTYGLWKPYSVSPNGERVFAELTTGAAEEIGYPRRSYYVPCAVLYFEAGAGLKEKVTYDLFESGDWFDGNRYYVYTAIAPADERPILPILRILDTDVWEEIKLGLCENHPDGKSLFEFSGPYIIWLTQEEIPSGELCLPEFGDIKWKPALKAYEFGISNTTTVLETDTRTITEEPTLLAPYQGIYSFSVKLVPTGPAPPEITESHLYRRFNGGVASALTR